MKKLSKVFALVLAFVMLASVSSFAATLVEGTNGKTIDLSFAFTDTSANPITSVAADSTFIIQVNFAGNAGDPDDTSNLGMCGYNVLVKYDTEKMSFTNKQAGLQVTANPTANATFADGIAYYTAAFEAGALNDADWAIYEEGNLFRIRAKALVDLTEADLNALEFVQTATNTAGTLTNSTKVIDQDKAEYTITVPGGAETIKGAVVEGDDADIELPKSEGSLNNNTYTNVATFKATLGAAVNYGEAGFIWVADDVETENKYTVDASVIAGGGTFEYGVVMAGIPADVDIDAIPYYVTAE